MNNSSVILFQVAGVDLGSTSFALLSSVFAPSREEHGNGT